MIDQEMADKQLEKITAGVPLDDAYGRTPEKALLRLLEQHPDLESQGAFYRGGRPAFMDVKATRDFYRHDWDQYEQPEGVDRLVDGDRVRFASRVAYDAPITPDQRILISLSNVRLVVPRGDRWQSVKFDFSIQMRESELEGEEELRDGDHHWRCERKSTEILDDFPGER